MLNKCQHCNKEYEAKRSDSKTCSPACRQAIKRDSVITPKCDIVTDKIGSEISVTKFVNHITGEEHDITEVSKRTGLSYDLKEVSVIAKFKKHRCSGCGEPTWFGCAECGKQGGIHKEGQVL